MMGMMGMMGMTAGRRRVTKSRACRPERRDGPAPVAVRAPPRGAPCRNASVAMRHAAPSLTAPFAALLVALCPLSAGAQGAAEAQLCSRAAAPERWPDARPRVQAMATGAGALADFAQGCLQLVDGRLERAEAAFARAVAQAPHNAVAEFHLGQAYGAQAQRANVFRQPSLARRTRLSFERAVQLDPDYLDARQGLITFYLLAPGVLGGSEERAREQAAEVRRRNPYRGAFAASQLHQRRKDWSGVAREMDAVARQYPDSVGAWTTLLAALGRQRQWDEAWTATDRMLVALGEAPAAQFLVGRLAAESGQRLDRGEAALQRYLQHRPAGNDPPLADAHWRLGMIRERQGARDAARAAYQTAVGLDPKFAPAHESLEKLR